MSLFCSFVLILHFLVSFLVPSSEAAAATGGALSNLTIGLDDPGLIFSSGWSIGEFATAFGSKFAFADGLGDEVIVELPPNTVDVYYVGFARSGGASYAACLDCELSVQEQQFQEVNAHNASDNGSNPPVVLYSFLNLDPSIQHAVSTVNLQDPNFGDTSQITFVAVIASVLANNGTPTSSSEALSTTAVPSSTSSLGQGPNITTSISVSTTSISTSMTNGTSGVATSVTSSTFFSSSGAGQFSTTTSHSASSSIPTFSSASTTNRSAVSTTTAGNTGQPSGSATSTTSLSITSSLATTSLSTTSSPASSSNTNSLGGSTTAGSVTPGTLSGSSSITTSQSTSSNSGIVNTFTAPLSSSTTSVPSGSVSQLPGSSGAPRSSTSLSKSTIAVIATVSSLAMLSVLGTIFFILRRNRNRLPAPGPGEEDGIGLIREVGAPAILSTQSPVRPVNPYAGTVPPTVPITSPYSHMPVQFPPPVPRNPNRSAPQTTQAWLNRKFKRAPL